MRRRLGNDDGLIAILFQMYLDDAATMVTDVRRAVAARDSEAVRQRAHRLKSSAGNLSAVDLVRAAGTLEHAAERGEAADFDDHFHRLSVAAEALETELQALVGGR